MKCKALVSLAFVLAFLVASSIVDAAFAQTLAAGEWKEVARRGAIWHKANYYYYQSFDNDGDGWILWNYTDSFDFQLWTQTFNDDPSHIDSLFLGELLHVRDFIIYNPQLDWNITCRFWIRRSSTLWVTSGNALMAIYNNTDTSDLNYGSYETTELKHNFGSLSTNGDYYIWIWNNGTSLKFRVSFKKPGAPLIGGETVLTYTLSLEVPSHFFLNVRVMLKVWKDGDGGQITGKTIYERLYVGGPTSEPENIRPLPSWLDSAIKFIIDLFCMLSELIINIAPYAGILIGIWILSGVVNAAETGEFSAMWEPFMTLYSLFTGILGIVQKAVKTIVDWIVKILEWIGLIGVAAA